MAWILSGLVSSCASSEPPAAKAPDPTPRQVASVPDETAEHDVSPPLPALTKAELDAVEIHAICPFGEAVEISPEELRTPEAGAVTRMREMNVARAGELLRRHGYRITRLGRCHISGAQFKKELEQDGAGPWIKLLGESGTGEITTISGMSDKGLADLHVMVSSKRCWPEQPRVREDRFTGSALWQHDTHEVGLWCFANETTDIDPECAERLLRDLLTHFPADSPD